MYSSGRRNTPKPAAIRNIAIPTTKRSFFIAHHLPVSLLHKLCEQFAGVGQLSRVGMVTDFDHGIGQQMLAFGSQLLLRRMSSVRRTASATSRIALRRCRLSRCMRR